MDQVAAARTMLKNVIDPELGLNIVDLGLIYELKVENNKALVLMTFTTIGCPLSGKLTSEVYDVLEPLGFDDIKVNITYSPPWTPDKMSDEAKKRLGIG